MDKMLSVVLPAYNEEQMIKKTVIFSIRQKHL